MLARPRFPRRPSCLPRSAAGWLAVCVAVLPVLAASPAAAQRGPFVDHLIAFHSALAGTFGDEGPLVAGHLEEMATSLAAWDAEIRAAEADLAARVDGAASADRLQARIAHAALYLERARFDDALREIDAALALDAERAAVHVIRGLALEQVGRDAEALDAFRRGWTLDPADPVKAYLLLDRLPRDAAPAAREAPLSALLTAHRLAGGFDPRPAMRAPFVSFALVQDGASERPVFAPAAYATGFAHLVAGRYADAVAAFRGAAAVDPLVSGPAAGSARLRAGAARLRAGDAAAAVEHLEAAVADHPDSSEAQRMLGMAYGATGRLEASNAALARAVALAPRSERARLALGRALIADGRLDEVDTLLRETIAALPESAEARALLAEVYDRQNRIDDALRELEAAAGFVVLAGKSALYWRIADMHHRQQAYDAVVDALHERTRLDPNQMAAHADLGLAHTRAGRQEEALVELVIASLMGPETAEVLAAVGQIHLSAGRFEEAEAVLRRAVALDPELAQPRYVLGTVLMRRGRTDEGRRELAEFQRLRSTALDAQREAFDELRPQEPGQ